jgi:hypothetical protein
MTPLAVDRLDRIPVRDVWKDEDVDFTPWLRENIEILGEKLDMELSVADRETAIGDFEADILAEDSEGNLVVIENQFGKSDHDHLGKLLTYLTNLDAVTAIWICEEIRQEHVEAIEWLNASRRDVSFYLIKVETLRIGNSNPAPLFTVVCRPSEESRTIEETKEEFVERHQKRMQFWEQLLKRSEGKTDLFSNVSKSKQGWIAATAGRPGLRYVYVIKTHSARVELYIDTGEKEENKKLFDALHAKKQEIEASFGEKLHWQRLDERISSRISKTLEGTGLRNEADWEQLQDKLIDTMLRLEKALETEIQRLD